MHPQTYSPGLTAATTTARALLVAGWMYDSTSPMADDTTIRTLLHPTGREIHARTDDGDEVTDLTLTGLTLDQVAGAVLGAGLTGPAAEQPAEVSALLDRHIATEQPKAEPDPRQVAWQLVINGVAGGLPIPAAVNIPGHYSIFEVRLPQDDREGADAWAAYLGLDAPEMEPPLEGCKHDVYRSETYSYPKLPGWKVEVTAYCDKDGVQ